MEPATKKPRNVQVSKGPCVWWARNDLRVQDNPVIRLVCGAALVDGRPFVGVFCFDPRFLDKSPYGRVTDPNFEKSISTRKPINFSSRKTNALRARFWVQCVLQLREEMRARGSDLLICYGKPEEVLASLPTGTEVKCQNEPVSIEQTDVEQFVAKALIAKGSKLRKDPGAMSLYHPDDLPFDIKDRPESYSALGWALGWTDIWTTMDQEANATPVRPCVPAPTNIPKPPEGLTLQGQIPEEILLDEAKMLKHLGYSEEEIKKAQAQPIPQGGEAAAREHLEGWLSRQSIQLQSDNPQASEAVFWDLPCAGQEGPSKGHDPFQWVNLSTADGGLRISHYMAVGCISAREIFNRAKETPNFAMVAHRLLWRDFHRLYAIKYHRRIAWLQGPAKVQRSWKDDPEIAEAWKKGLTGVPYIDACQRELATTGWLAYKGRKTSAHFLVFDLWMDWRIGAFHDEECLFDYDFAMNYGNWAVVSKIGNGGASAWDGSREFDPEHIDLRWKLRAEQKNDPSGSYIRKWVPELKNVPDKHIHSPWYMTEDEMKASQCVLGTDYPKSLVGPLELESCQPRAW
uniref:Cryptochrome DASH n=1 Tax=Crypthecodinium cohnii TaxID=2866 RepID=A0A516AGN1_CRYCO|nr:cryptochrome DASH [Crypthecodinium cohnii]USW07798.1 cryptochrome DASH [Crypthecodinium cohnii]